MKLFLIMLLAVLLTACGPKNDTTIMEKSAGINVGGTYVASDKTAFTLKDGVLTREAHGVFPARVTTYKIVNKRIEFTFESPGYFLIKDDKTLVFLGLLEYSKN